MNYLSESLWVKINNFLLGIETIQDPKEFCIQILKELFELIPYDQARIYFISDNGKISDEFLVGVEQWWSYIYLEYYSKLENGRYSIPTKKDKDRYVLPMFKGGVHNWTSNENDEFIKDYIKPQGLNYSLGFGLFNSDALVKSSFSLDRTGHKGYTDEEIRIMTIVQPHLDNIYKHLLHHSSSSSYTAKNQVVQKLLTKRESEIADLLRNGMTPANISKKLFLSLPTTYKHISNIHTKLNVSNRQELLLKLMNISSS